MSCHYKKAAAGKGCGTFSVIVASLLLLAFAAAAQERFSEGARSGGMGGAYMGVSDDVNGIYFNPSGSAYSPDRWIFECSAENLFSAGLLRPFGNDLINEGTVTFSSLGVIYNHLEKPNRTIPVLAMAGKGTASPLANAPQKMPTSNVFSAGFMGNFLNTGLLNEMALRAFVSKGFFEKHKPIAGINHRPHGLVLSVTGKLWGYQYDSDIAEHAQVNAEVEREAIRDFFAKNDRSQYSFGLDFGASVNPFPHVRAGLGWLNVLQPNLGLATDSKFPRSLRGGVAVLAKPEWQWLVAADLEKQENLDGVKYFIGSESMVPGLRTEVLKLRLGVNRNWFSAGLKLAVFSINVNYALLFFRHDNSLYNHRFSLSYSRRPPANGTGGY
ncbi:hypothetical protein L0337_34840 [candidate division KSB1 bacterium]|nr:hypothetical protein [candidate division KSB1 bacterium]